MAMALTALPLTVTPSSLVKGTVVAQAWTEPADTDEAAQCLVSMSSSNNSTSHTGKHSDVIASLTTQTPVRAPHSKPDRLSLACNPCRKRKVRCDAHQPKCHNCIRRGDVCVTSDPRKAGAPPAIRQKATRRHTGPSLSAHQRAREVEQQQQRQLLLQTRRDQWSVGSTGTPDGIESELDDDEPVDQDQDDHDDLFGSDLVADHIDDEHSFSRPTSCSQLMPEPALSQCHREEQHGQLHRVPLQDRQTQPISTASLQSPHSIGSSSTLHSSTPLVELVRSSSASLIRTRNRNNSSSNAGGDTELPTWVSRAYKEVSAAHAPSIDQLQTSTEHDEQQQPHSTVATPDVVINTDGSPNRFKVLGGSSLQYLFKFTDVCLASYGFDATAPLFRHGLTPSDDFVMPLFPTLPDLPAQEILSHCIDIFVARVWPVFPALDREAVQAEADLLLKLQAEEPSTSSSTARPAESLQSKVRSSQVPGLVVLYAIICIGLHETSPADSVLAQVRENAASYLTACYSLHAHLTAMPYQPSVQALLLVALALRACGKDGQAWYILGLALRLAMSLGLHKSVETPQQRGLPLNSSASLRRRLWWSCFSLERLLQLECGRPSSIDSTQDYGSLDANLTIRLPGFGLWRPGQTSDSDSSPNSNEQDHHGVVSPEESEAYDLPEQRSNRLFTAWVSLSAIMGQISDRFYNHRFGHATELLGETARLAQCLTKWEASLPPSLKPGSSSFAINVDHEHVAIAFLAQQYYHAKMAVLRIAILFPPQGFQKEVQKRALELADIGQLLGAASQCVSAARSLIHLNLQLADSGIHSTLVGVQQTFLASIVLALSILRSPRSRLVRSDVELLTEATSHVESCYESWGYPAAFLTIFSRLRDRTTAISRGQALPIVPLSSLIANGNAAMQAKSRVASAHHSRRTSHIHGSQAWIGEAATPARKDDGLLSDEQSQAPAHHQAEAGSKEAHEEHLIAASLFANSNGLDGSNAGSGALPFTSETGMEAFTSMDFEDFWDMLKADIFM